MSYAYHSHSCGEQGMRPAFLPQLVVRSATFKVFLMTALSHHVKLIRNPSPKVTVSGEFTPSNFPLRACSPFHTPLRSLASLSFHRKTTFVSHGWPRHHCDNYVVGEVLMAGQTSMISLWSDGQAGGCGSALPCMTRHDLVSYWLQPRHSQISTSSLWRQRDESTQGRRWSSAPHIPCSSTKDTCCW